MAVTVVLHDMWCKYNFWGRSLLRQEQSSNFDDLAILCLRFARQVKLVVLRQQGSTPNCMNVSMQVYLWKCKTSKHVTSTIVSMKNSLMPNFIDLLFYRYMQFTFNFIFFWCFVLHLYSFFCFLSICWLYKSFLCHSGWLWHLKN